jgi:ectoine hydroxylase-related dioxygenase (phytanoyl-CoA dioxygenase family)
VLEFLRDGVTIIPQAISLDLLDRLDEDLALLSDLSTAPAIYGDIGIDGKEEHYKARHLRNLSIRDFRQEPPGLKLVDLHRYFDSAREIAFSKPITDFLEGLFGSPAGLIQSLTFWKSSEQPVHQDFSYVHYHSRIAQLAAAWIPLEDIDADAGPLVYYKGSHHPEKLGFYVCGEGSILASRDATIETFDGYTRHLKNIISTNNLQASIFLPRRGDLLIWHGALIHGGTAMRNPTLTRKSFVTHYTSAASHGYMQRFRIGEGYGFFEPPVAKQLYQPSLARRIVNRAGRSLRRFLK